MPFVEELPNATACPMRVQDIDERQKSKKFFIRTLFVLLGCTEPTSKRENPICIKNTRVEPKSTQKTYRSGELVAQRETENQDITSLIHAKKKNCTDINGLLEAIIIVIHRLF